VGNVTTDTYERSTDLSALIRRHSATSDDIAQIFGLSRETVRRKAAEGVLPHIKIGSKVRYSVDDVARALLQVNE